MEIIEALEFYYSKYSLINVKIEMSGGIKGKAVPMTKKEALQSVDGYENEKIVEIIFQTHHTFDRKAVKKMENPFLYIMYN
jgi:hypothetical protein